MLLVVNTLSKGYSGVRLEILNTLVEMLNKPIEEVFDMSTPWKRALVEDTLKATEE